MVLQNVGSSKQVPSFCNLLTKPLIMSTINYV